MYAYVPIFGFYDPFFAWWGPGVRVVAPHHVRVRHVVVVPSGGGHR